MHVIAAKAVALGEALSPDFKEYARQTVDNARTMAAALSGAGMRIVSGGTDNHLMLVDLRGLGLTGKEAEARLEDVGITVNKNAIPHDPEKPFIASGIRIGTSAVTTCGMQEAEITLVASLIECALKDRARGSTSTVRSEVAELARRFQPYRAMSPTR